MRKNTHFDSTMLGQLERYANELGAQHSQKYFFSGMRAKALKDLSSAGKSESEKASIDTGAYACYIKMDGSLSDTKEAIKLADLRNLYSKVEYFRTQYPSFEIFLLKLYEYTKENAKAKEDLAVSRSNTSSQASDNFKAQSGADDTLDETTFYPIPLNTNISALVYQTTECDASWTLKHLCRDDHNQLYWRFNCYHEHLGGHVYPLSIKIKDTERLIAPDSDFWEAFFEEESETIKAYFEAVMRFLISYKNGVAQDYFMQDYEDNLPPVEAGLRSICPTVLLSCLSVGFKVATTKGAKYIKDVQVKLKNMHSSKPYDSFTKANLQASLSVALLQNVPMSKLHTIKVFDDVGTDSIHTLPKRPCTLDTPTAHPDLRDYGCNTWYKFLRSTDTEGHTKFPSQRMGELRLAKAVVGIVDKEDFSRQILACFGSGNDGKSICFDAIASIIGKELAQTGLSAKAVMTDDFGLQNSINKRMIVVDDIPDPYSFFVSDRVKRISGAAKGELQINRKFEAQYLWSPSGCKIIMSTNKACSLYDEASITRCMPLTFTKNFRYREQMDAVELTDGLISEGTGFIKWCYATCLYYNNVKNVNGDISPLFLGAHHSLTKQADQFSFVGKNLIICTDDQYDRWCAGELDLIPDAESERRLLRNEAYLIETTIPHKADPFVTIKQADSEDDEVNEYFKAISDIIFRQDTEAYIKNSDLGLSMLEFCTISKDDMECSPKLKRLFSLLKACGFCDYKDWQKLSKSTLYRNFKQYIMDSYNLTEKRIQCDYSRARALCGARMMTAREILDGEDAFYDKENAQVEAIAETTAETDQLDFDDVF